MVRFMSSCGLLKATDVMMLYKYVSVTVPTTRPPCLPIIPTTQVIIYFANLYLALATFEGSGNNK